MSRLFLLFSRNLKDHLSQIIFTCLLAGIFTVLNYVMLTSRQNFIKQIYHNIENNKIIVYIDKGTASAIDSLQDKIKRNSLIKDVNIVYSSDAKARIVNKFQLQNLEEYITNIPDYLIISLSSTRFNLERLNETISQLKKEPLIDLLQYQVDEVANLDKKLHLARNFFLYVILLIILIEIVIFIVIKTFMIKSQDGFWQYFFREGYSEKYRILSLILEFLIVGVMSCLCLYGFTYLWQSVVPIYIGMTDMFLLSAINFSSLFIRMLIISLFGLGIIYVISYNLASGQASD